MVKDDRPANFIILAADSSSLEANQNLKQIFKEQYNYSTGSLCRVDKNRMNFIPYMIITIITTDQIGAVAFELVERQTMSAADAIQQIQAVALVGSSDSLDLDSIEAMLAETYSGQRANNDHSSGQPPHFVNNVTMHTFLDITTQWLKLAPD